MKINKILMAILAVFTVFAFYQCTTEPVVKNNSKEIEAFSALQKGGPNKGSIFNGGLATQDVILDGGNFGLDFSNYSSITGLPQNGSDGPTLFTGGVFDQYSIVDGNGSALELNNFFYLRRGTNTDPATGIRFKEEINDRDWFAQVTNNAGSEGTFWWMDGNPGSSNVRIQAVSGQNKSDSDIWFTDSWMMFGQTHGIYTFKNLKTFETNDEAKAYFSSKSWNRLNTIYKTSDGTLKATY